MKIWKIKTFVLLMTGLVTVPLAASAAARPDQPSCYNYLSGDPRANFTPINFPSAPPASATIQLERLSTCRAGFFNSKGSEIVAHDPLTQRLWVVNLAEGVADRPATLDVLDIRDPAHPVPLASIDLSATLPGVAKPVPTSVAVKGGIVALAVEAGQGSPIRGKVLFYNPAGNLLKAVEVGIAPDMVIFTPDGQRVLVANQGAPTQPGGSISIIDLRTGVVQASVINVGFDTFQGNTDALIQQGVRIYPGFSFAQSLIPEYLAVSRDSRTAWATLEVNNALAVVDIHGAKITDILPLGFKDHSLATNGFLGYDGQPSSNALDASDRDGAINIRNWPVLGMYQPDAIAAYQPLDQTYLVTANEGDAFTDAEETQVRNLPLDPSVFPTAATLQSNAQLGRLRVTTLLGNTDSDPEYEALYAFGARSFSIWSSSGQLVYDSGDDIERITAAISAMNPQAPVAALFNTTDDENVFDSRSDNRGPEPEGVTVGNVYGHNYAFVGLERPSGVMVYEITDPSTPAFQQYLNNRNFAIDPADRAVCNREGRPESTACATVGDLGPEGILFIPLAHSPIGAPLLVTANETSSSTTLFRINWISAQRPGDFNHDACVDRMDFDQLMGVVRGPEPRALSYEKERSL